MNVPEKSRKTEHLIKKFVNERRVDRGLDRLDSDRALDASAHEHARDMARRGYFGHKNPEGRGPSERCKAYNEVYENIAYSITNSESAGGLAGDFLETWMTSPTHRNHILNSSFDLTGAGVWADGSRWIGVQVFAPSTSSKSGSLLSGILSLGGK